ncbi:MAG: helix-turn-helix domain-containing protein [Acidimicrobiia bacterium]
MEKDAAARMEELGSFIRTQRRASRLSLRRLSEASGISNPYLSQIERGLRKPSAEVLQQIGRALGVPVEELYVRAGILEAGADGDLVARIRREPGLSGDQKDALIRLYLQFRSLSDERGEGTDAG